MKMTTQYNQTEELTDFLLHKVKEGEIIELGDCAPYIAEYGVARNTRLKLYAYAGYCAVHLRATVVSLDEHDLKTLVVYKDMLIGNISPEEGNFILEKLFEENKPSLESSDPNDVFTSGERRNLVDDFIYFRGIYGNILKQDPITEEMLKAHLPYKLQ